MDIRSQLEEEHSKAQSQRIAEHIGSDAGRFAELMDVYFGKEPELALPYAAAMLEKMAMPEVHDALKRNALKVFQALPALPGEAAGALLNYCFDAVASPQEKPAIRAYALTLASRLSANEPLLQKELKLVVEEQMPHATAAFRSRGRKILKALEKKGI